MRAKLGAGVALAESKNIKRSTRRVTSVFSKFPGLTTEATALHPDLTIEAIMMLKEVAERE